VQVSCSRDCCRSFIVSLSDYLAVARQRWCRRTCALPWQLIGCDVARWSGDGEDNTWAAEAAGRRIVRLRDDRNQTATSVSDAIDLR